MRARFIDRDGRSFFGEVFGELPPMWRRFKPDTTSYRLDFGGPPRVMRSQIENFYREFWLHKYGPIATPVLDVYGAIQRDCFGFMAEVVYRYVGDES